MKILFAILIMLSTSLYSNAQIKLNSKIDTTILEKRHLHQFITSYFLKDTISNELWHPKYRGKKTYDYTMDWLWSNKTPKKLAKLMMLELVELQSVNDTLAYCKILARYRSEIPEESFSNVYKLYIVKINGDYFFDNCKEYDSKRFREFETKNIHFYVSPFYTIDAKKMKSASRQLAILYKELKKPRLKKPIDYYMCSSEDELNNLSNLLVWDGGLGAYTNIPAGFIVAVNDDPVYKHEFIHAILGSSANCFFMQEGIAVLYGGLNKGTKSYETGLAELKACYQTGKCTFDNLYERKVEQQFNSNLTYAFAGVFCKYLIDKYGLEFFYKLYYDKEITTTNFMEKIIEATGESRKEIVEGIEKMIVGS